jgi:hypothetical protein
MSVEPSDEEYLTEAEGIIMSLEQQIEELKKPVKLIIYMEQGVGGKQYWTNSNIWFQDILVVERTDRVVSEDVEIYDQAYDLEQYRVPLNVVEERMARDRKHSEEMQAKREEM